MLVGPLERSWLAFRIVCMGRQKLADGVELIVNCLLEGAKPRPHHQPAEYRSDVSAPSRHAVGRIQDFRDRQIRPLKFGHILFVKTRDHHVVRPERLTKTESPIAFVVVGQIVPVLVVPENDVSHTVLECCHPIEERLDTVG